MTSIQELVHKNQIDSIVVGAGLAGSECAWQMAERGLKVLLIEQRPEKLSPAHKTDQCAELVCSNSLKCRDEESAPGQLKWELKSSGSLVLKCAEKHVVPAGLSLAVDREKFAAEVTQTIENHPNIYFQRQQILHFEELIYQHQEGHEIPVVIATGPLTGEDLAKSLEQLTGNRLYFYDAIAPIVDGSTINRDIAFLQNRRNKGSEFSTQEGDYLNCPMTKDQYMAFIEELKKGETLPYHDFEKAIFFQGCQPIEALLERGDKTLAFGPMKPVGLMDPRTNERSYAVVQLRKEDNEGRAWNMVGFQSKLKYGEQKRIFRLIPGLENAEFFRMGSLHRNTYIASPALLKENFALKKDGRFYFAGQLTGVEGYLESTAVGCAVALSISYSYKHAWKQDLPLAPETTAIGALGHAIVHGRLKNFQPMNMNWGIVPLNEINVKDKEKKKKLVERAKRHFENWAVMAR